MRGKRARAGRAHDRGRIIPAHAGQTEYGEFEAGVGADHPRACGANRFPHATKSSPSGSSPRMRGKLCAGAGGQARGRIIPAHAGQTGITHPLPPVSTDHPRAYGANPKTFSSSGMKCGSSPRMRGKLHLNPTCSMPLRIIPAHAGQTLRLAHARNAAADHPRACGANNASFGMTNFPTGSSPRMRGKPVLWLACSLRFRIIPAHAGQTPFSG